MFKYIKRWYLSKFDNNEPAVFIFVIFVFLITINFFGGLIAPILAGIVISYLLDSVVSLLCNKCRFNRNISIYLVFLSFIALLVLLIIFLLPVLIKQAGQFLHTIPEQILELRGNLVALSLKYPNFISQDQVHNMFNATSEIRFDRIASIGQYLIKLSLLSLSSAFGILIYLFIVPLLSFFFLKDKSHISKWFISMLPREKGALKEVWLDMKPQLGNYVKGKTLECLIVTVCTYLGFAYFNLNYSLLLAIFVGLSVLIPYIGMVIVTIPVILIGLSQFGFTSTFFYMIMVYLIIQGLDGNLLVPILYSEALSLHPVAVISSVLVFGGIWGFWGLFFAIPFAALIKSGIKMWMRRNNQRKCEDDDFIKA